MQIAAIQGLAATLDASSDGRSNFSAPEDSSDMVLIIIHISTAHELSFETVANDVRRGNLVSSLQSMYHAQYYLTQWLCLLHTALGIIADC